MESKCELSNNHVRFSLNINSEKYLYSGIDLLNPIRIALLESIPNVGMVFNSYALAEHTNNPTDIKIIRNTSTLLDEMIGMRLSLVPLYFNPEEIEKIKSGQLSYKFSLNKTNDGDKLLDISTYDIDVYENDVIKPDLMKKLTKKVILTKLNPKSSIVIESKASIGEPRENIAYQQLSVVCVNKNNLVFECEQYDVENNRGIHPNYVFKTALEVLKSQLANFVFSIQKSKYAKMCEYEIISKDSTKNIKTMISKMLIHNENIANSVVKNNTIKLTIEPSKAHSIDLENIKNIVHDTVSHLYNVYFDMLSDFEGQLNSDENGKRDQSIKNQMNSLVSSKGIHRVIKADVLLNAM